MYGEVRVSVGRMSIVWQNDGKRMSIFSLNAFSFDPFRSNPNVIEYEVV